MKSIIFTHKGKREINQDYILVRNLDPETFLFIVADGMGGYEQGERAARLVSENILTYLSSAHDINPNHIQKAINKANLAIRQFKEKTGIKLGTTVGGAIVTSKEALCFWVGDVKIFHFKNNILQKESHSHTLMNEVIDKGSIVNSEQINKYKHVVTRSVQGEVDRSQIDFFKVGLVEDKDVFLICSDGVSDIFSGIQIQQILDSTKSNVEAMNIIEKRLLEEAKDNFSLILTNFNRA
ncbi:serine/threonine-protein phosphatase [Pedobacter sp. ISL-68]|uniref:PP2C family protein-serine/threonine phosphatase n=1 Tax=unclassified Pedobacter TaxID=2628915 RepID=UPI001BE639BF|nr:MULTISPECIES: protein phosphatase 2C domain-containing protein [unclassified Pedobacter]MBT2564703.1 serine/threonine-protein phosphatase [Pedobacter sp. ISL-64]MBT2592408.1 serine/threonine-protein phosphatase [Pedobacter sp. ISL-68]